MLVSRRDEAGCVPGRGELRCLAPREPAKRPVSGRMAQWMGHEDGHRKRLPRGTPPRPAGSRTPGTDGHAWLAGSIPGMCSRHALQQIAGQRVKQEMAGAEIGCGGPDTPAGDELKGGGRCGPTVNVQAHAQVRAQRAPGQADLDPARSRTGNVVDRPAKQAFAKP